MNKDKRNKIEEISNKLPAVLSSYPVSSASVFGSIAKGDDNTDSDIDILIEFTPGSKYSMFDLIDIENILTKTFNRKVDLVTKASLSPYIQESVNNSALLVYER